MKSSLNQDLVGYEPECFDVFELAFHRAIENPWLIDVLEAADPGISEAFCQRPGNPRGAQISQMKAPCGRRSEPDTAT
jgi:hypothetical protein